jgi:hypothetical protein
LRGFRVEPRVEREEEGESSPEFTMSDAEEAVEEWEVNAVLDSKYRKRWRKAYYLVS